MAIADNYAPLRQIGNGATTQFSSNWYMIAAAYAIVLLEDAVTGVQTSVPPGPGAGQYQLAFSASGFTVTYGTAPTASQYAVVARAVTLDQTDPYRTSKGYQGEVLEASLDKITAMIQDLNDISARSLKFQLGSSAIGVLPPPVDDFVIAWDGTTGLMKNGITVASITATTTAAAASAAAAAGSASAASGSASSASTSATLAQQWATLTSGQVAGTDTSAKGWAIGATGIADGAAKNWAQQTGADVTGAAALSRSSKSWAQENLAGATYGGSSKDWAQSASLPDNVSKSAKSYAADAASSAASASGGFINKFRNGSFDVFQRGNSITVTGGGGFVYTADGWMVSSTGGNLSIGIGGPAAGALRQMTLTGNTGVTATTMKQRIEGFMAAQLASKTVTVQFRLFNSTAASFTPTLTIKHPTTTRDDFSSLTTDINAQTLQVCPASSFTTISATVSIPSGAGNGLEVAIDFGAALSANTKTIFIGDADIRIATTVQPVEYRPYGLELTLNQRYFQTWGGDTATQAICPGQCYGTTNWISTIPYITTMRVAPSLSISAASDFAVYSNVAGVIAATAINLTEVGINSAHLTGTVTAGLVAGDATNLITQNTSARIRLSAEL